MKKVNKSNITESGFKTPDNYFNTFEENLLTELELKEHAPNNGMNVPKGYFESFKVEIPSDKNLKSESKVISLFRNQKWLAAASIAAAFIILLTLPNKQDNTLDFASLDSDIIESYLLNNDFDSTEINNLLTNSMAFETSLLEETLNDVHLEDYLYNNMELEDLNLE